MTLVNFRHFQESAVWSPPAHSSIEEERVASHRPAPSTPSSAMEVSEEQPMPIGPSGNEWTTGAAMARPSLQLQQQVEDLERTLPMARLRILEVRIDDLERARKR